MCLLYVCSFVRPFLCFVLFACVIVSLLVCLFVVFGSLV